MTVRLVRYLTPITLVMPIIKNYGFLWDRNHIYRGAGSNAGHLKGTAPGRTTADFREQIGVYVLYDPSQRIVYVGQAGNGNATLFTRLKNHMDGQLWNRWQFFSWVGFRDVNSDGKLSGQQNVDSGVSGFNTQTLLTRSKAFSLRSSSQSSTSKPAG